MKIISLKPGNEYCIDFDAYDYQINQFYDNGTKVYKLIAVLRGRSVPFTIYSDKSEERVSNLLYSILNDYMAGKEICNIELRIKEIDAVKSTAKFYIDMVSNLQMRFGPK